MKNIILITVAVMLIAHCAIAQDTTFSSEYFKLIKTYNTLDEVYLAHPDLKPAPPKIVINEDEVLFYNDNREVVNRMSVVREDEIQRDDRFYEKYHSDFKIHRGYRAVEGELLLVNEYYGNEYQSHFKNASLYDKAGRFLINIIEDTDVKISNNRQFFATTYAGEAGIGLVQIFDFKGKTICTYKNETELGIRYDRHDNLIIKGFFDFKIIVKDNSCNELVSVNTLNELHIGDISSFFYLKDTDKFLISIKETGLFFFNNDDNSLIWKANVGAVVDQCIFKTKKNLIFIQIRKVFATNNTKGKHIVVMDYSTGNDILYVPIDEMIILNNNLIVIKEGGKYYEYEI